MKPKTPFLVITLFIISQSLFAQVRFGVKGGLNVSKVILTNWDEGNFYRYKPGFHGGGYINWDLSKRVGVTGEILYSNKGYKIKDQNSNNNINLNYLTIPLLFNFAPIKNLSIQAGPEIGYLLVATNKDARALHGLYAEKLDLSADFGLNYSLTQNFNIAARYIHGFSSILTLDFRDTDGMPLGYPKEKNRTLQLSVGYTFGKKH